MLRIYVNFCVFGLIVVIICTMKIVYLVNRVFVRRFEGAVLDRKVVAVVVPTIWGGLRFLSCLGEKRNGLTL